MRVKRGGNRRCTRGLSQVVTTLIILVASVILAVSVGTFGSVLFQQESRTETLGVSNVHAWVNSTGSAAAMVVTNTGGEPTSIKEIKLLGSTVPLRSIYTWRASDANVTVNGPLNVTSSILTATGSTLAVPVMGSDRTFNQATGETQLGIRDVVVIYIANSDITTAELGSNVEISIRATRAVYALKADVVSAG